MPILLIILSILVIIILGFLFTDIGITISYNHKDGLLVSLNWLFIKSNVLSKVKKNAEEKEKPVAKADAVLVSKDILSIIAEFKHKFTITELKINLNIGTGDAADTAIACGTLYSSIYGILGALQNAIYIVPPQININPDYSSKVASGNFSISFRTKPILLRKILFKIIKLFKNQKRTV
jgi:hypothetical protein